MRSDPPSSEDTRAACSEARDARKAPLLALHWSNTSSTLAFFVLSCCVTKSARAASTSAANASAPLSNDVSLPHLVELAVSCCLRVFFCESRILFGPPPRQRRAAWIGSHVRHRRDAPQRNGRRAAQPALRTISGGLGRARPLDGVLVVMRTTLNLITKRPAMLKCALLSPPYASTHLTVSLDPPKKKVD